MSILLVMRERFNYRAISRRAQIFAWRFSFGFSFYFSSFRGVGGS
jgi:hypothetical protein